MGWEIKGELPDLNKFIVILGSHTSNWDFVLAICTIWMVQVKVTIIGKKELFKFPFGSVFRALGVVPIERRKSQNQVDAIAEMFDNRENLVIAIAPEGTRKKVEIFKSGFYYIALKANLPVVAVIIHGTTKTILIQKPYYNTRDKEIDLKHFNHIFKSHTGIIPANSF